MGAGESGRTSTPRNVASVRCERARVRVRGLRVGGASSAASGAGVFVVDTSGIVFNLLRSAGLGVGLWRVTGRSRLSELAGFALAAIASYDRPDWPLVSRLEYRPSSYRQRPTMSRQRTQWHSAHSVTSRPQSRPRRFVGPFWAPLAENPRIRDAFWAIVCAS